MCVNTHYIYNRYIKKNILVDCGKCPSCLQKKAAHRANRIRNNVRSGEICLFVTLTYRNEFVPYVREVDVRNQLNVINVYRDAKSRRVRSSSDYGMSFKTYFGTHILQSYWCHDLWPTVQNHKLLQLNKKKGCIGVCYYADLQDFYKRLRQNLKRNFNYHGSFTSFSCSEYGGHSYRPHFHALIFIPKSSEDVFRRAIVKSWPYADRDRTAKFIEVARDCASYVSSYVNSGSLIHSLLSFPYFRQKHSYSKTFGMAADCFNLPSLLEKVRTGDLRYYSKVFKHGQSSIAGFPVPKYVINRFFPVFKGFSRLLPYEIHDVVLHPDTITKYRQYLDYSPEEEKSIFIRLHNSYDYFHNVTGLNRFDYAIYFVHIWIIYKSVVLRDSYSDIRSVLDWRDFYENIGDVSCGVVIAPSLTDMFDVSFFELNPNKTRYRLEIENRLVPLYFKLCKQKVVTNQVMSQGLSLDV